MRWRFERLDVRTRRSLALLWLRPFDFLGIPLPCGLSPLSYENGEGYRKDGGPPSRYPPEVEYLTGCMPRKIGRASCRERV